MVMDNEFVHVSRGGRVAIPRDVGLLYARCDERRLDQLQVRAIRALPAGR